MPASTIAPALITAEMPGTLDPRWSRLPGIQVDGRSVTISPADYFFRFGSCSWLVTDWETVRDGLLPVTETAKEAIEQATLEFIRANARTTTDPAEVLGIAWHVYSHLFREELLPVADLEHIGPAELQMLREAATFMALNRVRDDGSIANVGPCWFFPAATGVVFDLDEQAGQQLDEAYHGTWFNETRRIESIKAHAALGGRLVHGCQSVPNQSGGAVMPYGASIDRFRQDLEEFRDEWLAAVRSYSKS